MGVGEETGGSDCNHIFRGTDLCNAPRRPPVHKTHLKFSRQAGKVAAVLVDEAEGGGGGCGAPRGL